MNFTLSKENLKETLLAFRAINSVVDITREVFYAITPLSYVRSFARNLASSLALVLTLEGSHSATSKTVPIDLIVVSESRKESSEKGMDSLVQNASPPPSVVRNIVIGDRPAK